MPHKKIHKIYYVFIVQNEIQTYDQKCTLVYFNHLTYKNVLIILHISIIISGYSP
jgi:hypothetical protein